MAQSVGFPFVLVFLSVIFLISNVQSATFTIENKCSFPVWPGTLSTAGGTPEISAAGASALQPGQSTSFPVPASWSGRFWGRTLCQQDSAVSKFSCLTGDCGSATPDCSGVAAVPPATLAEFTLNGAGGLDFYDVSLVDGFNLPITISPQHSTGGVNCLDTGCDVDLNKVCPKELVVTDNKNNFIACKSACGAFGDPAYCCSGAYSTPDTCKPSSYSMFFKKACPKSYSYAYDDGSSTFTCVSSPDYVITFCHGTDHMATENSSSNSQSSVPNAFPKVGPSSQVFAPIPNDVSYSSSEASAGGYNRKTAVMLGVVVLVAVSKLTSFA